MSYSKNFSRYSVAQLEMIATYIDENTHAITLPVYPNFKSAFDNFLTGRGKDVLSAKQVAGYEVNRDDHTGSMFQYVEAMQDHPDENTATVAQQIHQIIETYGGMSIRRLKNIEQSAQFARIVEKIEEISPESRSLIGFDVWYSRAKTANDLYVDSHNELSQSKGDNALIQSATAIRRNLEITMLDLVNYVELMSRSVPTPEMESLQNYLSEKLK